MAKIKMEKIMKAKCPYNKFKPIKNNKKFYGAVNIKTGCFVDMSGKESKDEFELYDSTEGPKLVIEELLYRKGIKNNKKYSVVEVKTFYKIVSK